MTSQLTDDVTRKSWTLEIMPQVTPPSMWKIVWATAESRLHDAARSEVGRRKSILLRLIARIGRVVARR
jgi:hypothetical protein